MKILKTEKYITAQFSGKLDEFYPGDMVRISEGSGVDSNKIVIIVARDNIQTDGRGVPTNVEGAYKPVNWNEQVAIQYEDGTYGTMFINRLEMVQSKTWK